MWRWGLLLLIGCDGEQPGTSPEDEADADTDADSDADADADADTDADTDFVPPELLFGDDMVLVVPGSDGLKLLRNDGSVAFERPWDGLVGSCPQCGGEGATADGDGLLVAFTTGPSSIGGIARLDATASLEWRVDGISFPHDAIRDPADDTVVVSETLADRLIWLPSDGSTVDPVRTLDESVEGWQGGMPNGMDLFPWQDRTYLLVSHRGGALPAGGPGGHLTMWDVTTAGAPSLVWRFPSTGVIDTPHGPIYRWFEGRWWLLWAHTEGAPNGGSVGLAVTDDPLALPEYVADLVPSGGNAPFEFLRGVELTSDGTLYLTDSGFVSGPIASFGRVLEYPMPTGLEPTGATGALGDQVEVDLPGGEVLIDGLGLPFEGWLWEPTFSLQAR